MRQTDQANCPLKVISGQRVNALGERNASSKVVEIRTRLHFQLVAEYDSVSQVGRQESVTDFKYFETNRAQFDGVCCKKSSETKDQLLYKTSYNKSAMLCNL